MGGGQRGQKGEQRHVGSPQEQGSTESYGLFSKEFTQFAQCVVCARILHHRFVCNGNGITWSFFFNTF